MVQQQWGDLHVLKVWSSQEMKCNITNKENTNQSTRKNQATGHESAKRTEHDFRQGYKNKNQWNQYMGSF